MIGNASAWSLLNPAFFFERLREAGFEVDTSQLPKIGVTYRGAGFTMGLEDLTQVLASLGSRLMQEDAVVETFRQTALALEAGNLPPFDQLNVELRQFLGGLDSSSVHRTPQEIKRKSPKT